MNLGFRVGNKGDRFENRCERGLRGVVLEEYFFPVGLGHVFQRQVIHGGVDFRGQR